MPFGITVDRQTVEDGTATLRERDSTQQVRCTFKIIVCDIDGCKVEVRRRKGAGNRKRGGMDEAQRVAIISELYKGWI